MKREKERRRGEDELGKETEGEERQTNSSEKETLQTNKQTNKHKRHRQQIVSNGTPVKEQLTRSSSHGDYITTVLCSPTPITGPAS